MLKFRDYIYCDNNRLSSFISQISELNKMETSSSYEKQIDVDGTGNFGVAKLKTGAKETTATIYSFHNTPLEQITNWVLDSNNAVNYSGGDIDVGDKDKLIVLNGKMSMPEMSENVELLNVFARNSALFEMVSMSDKDKHAMGFIKESESIPILLEADSDYVFNCNLKKEFIIGEKDDFLDNLDDEITVIGRIDKVYNGEENVEIYDLSKEVFKLNRIVRRKIPKESLKDAIIYEKGPLVKITPIIIYR